MYYTLVTKHLGNWVPQFGDYDRSVVCDERDYEYSDSTCKIICTQTDWQRDIDCAVSKLNEK